ncbi:MAG: hypothetical protein K0T01_1399 [Acidimicrobiia bacterium]|nr:hypothetical protein [Acidimicrobiia bacterium]
MSTSATQPGTTTRAGRSGKGLGIAAAALAVVIAAGFVFAVNQGNEVTGSGVNELSGPAEIAAARHAERVRLSELAAQAAVRPAGSAELARLNELAAQVKAESHPGFNIEKTKMQLAGQVATVNEYPGLNPEKTRMEMLIDKLDEQVYVPTTDEATELNQPEWDNRIP